MAYFSFKYGTPVAIIIGGPLDGEIIHLFDPDIDKAPRHYDRPIEHLDLKRGKVFLLPSAKPEQCYAAGPNGSGKSYYISKYMTLWHQIYPDRPIWIISDLKDDPVLDKVKGVQRIPLNEGIVDDPLKPEEFKDSLVVFDDIDSIADKDIAKAVNTLKDSLLKTSRHHNAYVLVTNHMICDYGKTRIIINECRNITVFPKSGASNQISRILKEYCGLSEKQLRVIMDIDSRWVTVHKNYPMYITYDHGIMLI